MFKHTNKSEEIRENYCIESSDPRYDHYNIVYTKTHRVNNGIVDLDTESLKINALNMQSSNIDDFTYIKLKRVGEQLKFEEYCFSSLPRELTDKVIEFPEHIKKLLDLKQ